MIEITNLTKSFGKTVALNRLNCTVQQGSVFGLVGSNGSGKSTLLRILAGVFEADGGTVRFEGKPSFENREVKAKIFFISDYPYFSMIQPFRTRQGCTGIYIPRGMKSGSDSCAPSFR